jgi:hypothetical protein
MLGGEPIFGGDRAGAGRDRDGADQRAVAEGRPHRMAAAVQIEDPPGAPAVRRELERRNAACVYVQDRYPVGRRELGVEPLVGLPELLEVGIVVGEVEQRRPQLRQPPGELAPDGERRGDGFVDVVEEPAGAIEQRLAGDGQLHPVLRPSQELQAEQLLEGAHLAAERGLADVEAVGGAAEVQLVGDGDKGA